MTDLPNLDEQLVALRAAIDLGVAVSATYNGAPIKLAPHLLYRRHGAPHVAALNLSRLATRKAPDRLSVYRVAGLSALQLTRERALLQPQLLGTLGHPIDQVIASVAAS